MLTITRHGITLTVEGRRPMAKGDGDGYRMHPSRRLNQMVENHHLDAAGHRDVAADMKRKGHADLAELHEHAAAAYKGISHAVEHSGATDPKAFEPLIAHARAIGEYASWRSKDK